LTVFTASALLVLNVSHTVCTACVVNDACRSDSRSADVTEASDADTDTDVRYSGASLASTVAVPPVTPLQPATPSTPTAVTPATSATARSVARSLPFSTAADVTGLAAI